MNTLEELLESTERRDALAADCAQLVHSRLRKTQGLSGRAMRAAFNMADRARPGVAHWAAARLLPDFVRALAPLYQRSRDAGAPWGDYLTRHGPEAADRLLGITDRRMATIRNPVLRSTYTRLRKQANHHVEAALPEFAALLEAHLFDLNGGRQ